MRKIILDYTFSGKLGKEFEKYLEDFLKEKQSLPFVRTLNENWGDSIKNKLEGFNPRDIVVCGIGGSSLGAEAVLRAILPVSFNSRGRRIFFFDNIDPERNKELLELIEPEKTTFIIISKSGGTTETISNFLLLFEKSGRKKKNFIIITDPEKGALRDMAKSEGFLSFPIPSYLGGRFSVLSPVGLVPLYLAGVNIDELIEGGKEGIEISSMDFSHNPSLLSASLIFSLFGKGKLMQVILVYSEHLHSMGFWYRQLFSESLGKDEWGQTPVLDKGSVDQHSKLQLYLDGPNDKVYTFWKLKEYRSDLDVPESPILSSELSGLSLSHIFSSMADSTEIALASSGRRTMSFVIPKIEERYLGQFITILESQVWYISKMKGINPFDQPGVERMKRTAKELIFGERKKGERKIT